MPQENDQIQGKITGTLSTGISVLDRNIGGGLPGGSMIYVLADAAGMAEIFLYQFTQSRKTYYFTTSRRPKYVLKDILSLNFDIKNIIFIDVYSEYYLTPSGEMIDNIGNEYADTKLLEFVEYNLKNIRNDDRRGDINIIFDNFSFIMNLNVNQVRIKRTMNLIYEVSKETSALTYLFGLKGSHPEHIENYILNSADVIFDISFDRGADKIVNKLSIPKIRGMLPTTEIIKFKICDGVQIDTSRDIA
ncbi:MAG: recombinase RecA [Methanomethylovorans sp.]|nr:recombinase RecA [Methanomethylovorans sp.]